VWWKSPRTIEADDGKRRFPLPITKTAATRRRVTSVGELACLTQPREKPSNRLEFTYSYGTCLQFKSDGSAIHFQEDRTLLGIHRWKIEQGVLSIERCPSNPGPTWLFQKCMNELMNASKRDDHKMTMQGDDMLILEHLQSNSVNELKRSYDMAD